MIFASKLSFTSVSKRFIVRNSSFEIKMRMDCVKMNVKEKDILIHMIDLARTLVFTQLQPDILEGYNNKRYI